MSGTPADTIDGPPDLGELVRVGPYAAAGRPFVIESNVPEQAEVLDDSLRDLRTDGDGEQPVVFQVLRHGPDWLSHPWGVWRDGEPCETTVTPDYIGPHVLWEVTRLVLEQPRPLVPVHAAAVVHDGRAVVLAGASRSGKSTLAAWLTAHGWGFLTDEVALLEPGPNGTTMVRPFWRPIGVRHPGPLDRLIADTPSGSEMLVRASLLGALATPALLTAIVFPRYEAGAETVLSPQHPAAAVRELAAHLPTLGSGGADVFFDIVAMVERTPVYRLDVDDLERATAVLTDLVEGEAAR